MKDTLRVLLTVSSGPGTAGIIHCLRNSPTKDIYIVAGSVEGNFDIGAKLADNYVKIPYCSSDKYIDEMIYICKKLNIDMIIPAFSDEIEQLTKNISKFNKLNIKILSPSYEIVHLLHNKDLMCNKFKSLNENIVPDFEVVSTVQDLKSACIKMGYPQKEICVKPARCNGGSRGFFVLNEDYDREYNFFYEKQKPICSLKELLLKLEGLNEIPKIIVMDYVSGTEYGVDVLANNGELLDCVIRKRLNPVVAGMEMRAQIIENYTIKEFVKKIVKVLKLSSILSFDIRFDSKEEKPYLLEINPRQGAYIGFASRKINLLAMGIDIKLEENIDINTYRTNYENIIGIRYFEEFAISNNNILL